MTSSKLKGITKVPDKGDINCQYRLASVYDKEEDYENAKVYYEKSSELNCIQSHYKLGNIYNKIMR